MFWLAFRWFPMVGWGGTCAIEQNGKYHMAVSCLFSYEEFDKDGSSVKPYKALKGPYKALKGDHKAL